MRLDKYLADMGCGSRSELKKLIRGGSVTVDGAVVKDPGARVTEASDVVFKGKPVRYAAFSYYMLNKPAGCVTATEDRRESTVMQYLPEDARRDLFPVGRLDKDTEGLLLLTNDGALAHRLLAPKHHVEKCYFARVKGCVTEEDVLLFRQGLDLGDYTSLPADLSILSSGEISEIRVVITEGKFHEIKRMFKAVGKEVLYLKRLRMGSLALDPDLAPGEIRPLTEAELASLRASSAAIPALSE